MIAVYRYQKGEENERDTSYHVFLSPETAMYTV